MFFESMQKCKYYLPVSPWRAQRGVAAVAGLHGAVVKGFGRAKLKKRQKIKTTVKMGKTNERQINV